MSYMMAKGSYLTDDDDHNVAHLMFYTPAIDPASWGADVSNSPVMLNPQFKGRSRSTYSLCRWADGLTELPHRSCRNAWGGE
jgi:hypothetical protein